MARLTVVIGSSIKGLKAGLSRARSGVRRLVAGVRKLGSLGGLGLVGMLYGLNRLSNASREFSRKMMEINTIARGTKAELKDLTKIVEDLSVEMGINATDSASAMYQALSAGIDKGKIKDFLNVAAQSSIAGATDMKTAVDGLTTVIKAYGLTADNAGKLSDIFFETIRLGKTTFAELSQELGKVVPIAAKMGISFEEVASALATMTKQGIATDKAAVALRGILNQLIAPNAKLAAALKEIAAAHGVASHHMLSFQQILKGLGDVTNNDAEEINAMIPNVRALTGALGLMGSSAEMAAEDLKDISDNAGAADKAFSEFADSDDLKLKQQEESIKRAARSWGEYVTAIKAASAALYNHGEDVAKANRLINARLYGQDGINDEDIDRAYAGKQTSSDIAGELHSQMRLSQDPAERARLAELLMVLTQRGIKAYEKELVAQKKLKEIEAERIRQKKAADAKKLAAENFKNKTESAELDADLKDEDDFIKQFKKELDLQDKKQQKITNIITSLTEQIERQALINQGLERQAFIQEKINRLKKAGASTAEIAAAATDAGKLYDLKKQAEINKNATATADQNAATRQGFTNQRRPIATDALRRIGGGAMGKDNGMDVQKKQLNHLEKINTKVDALDQKAQASLTKSGGVFI
jgi:TP901 family phage tail tape measure protein